MPKKIQDVDGNEHEVLTEEEIDAIVAEKMKSKDEEIGKLQEELNGLKKDPANKDWAGARGKIETLENQIKSLTEERYKDRVKFAEDIKGVRTGLLSGAIDTMRGSLSSGDAELDKKIKYHYDRIAGDVANEADAAEKLKDAFLLATGKQAPNPLNVARGFSGGGQPPQHSEQQNVQVVELGKKMGITDEDVKKYGPKAAEKKSNNPTT